MLINCSECGKKISDKAERCPHCGCPIINEYNLNSKDEICLKNENNVSTENESLISILSLLFYAIGIILMLINIKNAAISWFIAIVLAIIASFEEERSDVCASIVIWLNIIGIAIPCILVACSAF